MCTSKIRLLSLILFLFLSIGLLFPPILSAQTTTGTVHGVILDENGSPLAGVLVRAINNATGFPQGKRSDANGIYRIDFLPPGQYTITAELEGYQPKLNPNYLVEVNRDKAVVPPPIQ